MNYCRSLRPAARPRSRDLVVTAVRRCPASPRNTGPSACPGRSSQVLSPRAAGCVDKRPVLSAAPRLRAALGRCASSDQPPFQMPLTMGIPACRGNRQCVDVLALTAPRRGPRPRLAGPRRQAPPGRRALRMVTGHTSSRGTVRGTAQRIIPAQRVLSVR